MPIQNLTEEETVAKYQKLIYKFAHKWAREPLLSLEDLVGVGELAVVNAYRNYKEESTATFFTYVHRAIQTAIWSYAKSNRFTLKCTPYQQNNPDNIEFANIQQKSLVNMNYVYGSEDAQASVAASGMDPSEIAERSEEWDAIINAMGKLDHRDLYILTHSDKWFGDMSFSNIGSQLGVCRERVRQIEAGLTDRLSKIVRENIYAK